jgi:NAD(P)-dependent dehydrogenase (short-subunit alcohol dehydrogenase family)
VSGAGGPVAVVTGGAVGIGAAIAEELGRGGLYVVTVDPGVAVDGTPQDGGAVGPSTAQRIVEAGGNARASSISVTDEAALRALFAELVEEFGALDAVVNVAGISRPTGFASGSEDDWRAVLDVHLNGYLGVLRAALPIMTAAGHGRILGVTSGSGWRAADAGAYSCAKRAVAALTWRIGRETPPGVTVNALSPIAATRMVLSALSRQAGAGNTSGRDSATGGVSLGLSSVPPPEHLGPIGAYLAGDHFSSWSRGQIMFSNGAEVAWVAPPQLLESAPTGGMKSFTRALETLEDAVLAPAESAQVSNGGGNPRIGAAFEEPAGDPAASAGVGRCVMITDSPEWGAVLGDALGARGLECTGIGAWQGAGAGPREVATSFEGAAGQLAAVAQDAGAVDAVVVALAGDGTVGTTAADAPEWQRVLDEHEGITERIRVDAAWVRAVADLAAASERSIRVITVVGAATAGGRSRAQAATQLSRAAHPATSNRVDAFAIAVETADPGARGTVADLVAHLAGSAGAGALSGAELVVHADWFGLRSHPRPAGTVTFGGPVVPGWLDGALREMVAGVPERGREEG